jgi:hypothetical protein
MSTLRETIIHRRAGETPLNEGCYSADVSVPAVLISSRSSELWVLPWSHFVSARHQRDGDREQLTLLFANYQVELHGTNLILLMREIAGFRLDSLCSLPAKYKPLGNGSEPFIENLSVRPVFTPPSAEIAPLCQKKPVSYNDSFS